MRTRDHKPFSKGANMKFTSETKLFLGIILLTAGIIAGAAIFFSVPPKPLLKSELISPHTNITGNQSAKTWLVEFSDFQCPACKAFASAVDILSKKYPNDLSIAYRHFPLPQHQQAREAAIVAEAAEQQGKFWDMTHLLFANQETLSEASYASFAATLALDPIRFETDRKSASIAAHIDEDLAYGTTLGINATPTFYLNGVKLDVGMPADLEKVVVDAINRAKTLQK